MAVKEVEVEGIGVVSLYKRKGTASIRLSITHNGKVRVSLPAWAPYSSGIKFVESRKDWILTERPVTKLIPQGYSVGKAHHVHFEPASGYNISTRISGNQVRVLLPTGMRWDEPEAQKAALACAIRALKKEGRMLLPRRLELLAQQHGFTYKDVTIKQLKGRWGSCSQQKEIVLNCFLMQLPWDLIDYVIMHELVHTKVMAHGPVFWDEMKAVLPTVQQARKAIKLQKPVL